MNFRFLGRASAQVLVVAVMTLGVMGTVASATASATTPRTSTWYVSTTGSDSNNNCANVSHPCATINRALKEQNGSHLVGTIEVAAGTYTQQASVCYAGNSGDTIIGAGAKKTIIQPPSTGLASVSDTDTSYPQFYVINVCPGESNVTIEKLGVSGLNANGFFDSDGDGCGQNFNGIYFNESSGTIQKVNITGIDFPVDEFGCQGGNGIYVNSTSSDPADVTITKVKLTAPAPATATTSATLPAGTYSPSQHEILPVSSEPNAYSGGNILVDGMAMTATVDSPTSLYVSGTIPVNAPSGSTVNYNPYAPAYDKNGIACDDAYTTCDITASTIQGDGPTNAIGQNGIVAWGSDKVVIGGPSASDGNTISGNIYTGGGFANNGSGITILNGDKYNVSNNTVSDNDVNIYAAEVQAYGIVNPTTGSWVINDNTVSGATSDAGSAGEDGYGEGIQVDSTTNDVEVTDNTVTGSAQANVLLTGVENATVGGIGANQGNMISGSAAGAGLVVGGPGTECEFVYGNSCSPGAGNPDQFSSTGNDIFDNTISGNGGGIVVEGTYDPPLVGPSDPDAAYSNDFSGNQSTSNLLANIADFSAFGNSGAPQNGYSTNSCEPLEAASASLDGLTGSTPITGVTVTSGQDTVTDSTGFSSVSDGEGILDTTPGDIALGTYVTNVSGNTVTMSANASNSSGGSGDALLFSNYWGC